MKNELWRPATIAVGFFLALVWAAVLWLYLQPVPKSEERRFFLTSEGPCVEVLPSCRWANNQDTKDSMTIYCDGGHAAQLILTERRQLQGAIVNQLGVWQIILESNQSLKDSGEAKYHLYSNDGTQTRAFDLAVTYQDSEHKLLLGLVDCPEMKGQ